VIDLSRRDVLRSMAGLGVVTLTGGAGTLLGASTAAQSGADVLAADPEIAALVDSIVGVDMHSHAAGATGGPSPPTTWPSAFAPGASRRCAWSTRLTRP